MQERERPEPEIKSQTAYSVINSINLVFSKIFAEVPDNVTDIMLNPDGSSYYTDGRGETREFKMSISSDSLLRSAMLLASLSGENLNEAQPQLSCILPNYGYRVEILIPPAVEQVSMAIRVPNNTFSSLDFLESTGMFDIATKRSLVNYILSKKNIVISGETSSGKTTLLKALINEIPQQERLIIIEDETREVIIDRKNIVSIVTKASIFSGRLAVKSALRLNPDRIIYAETRDGDSALETLKAFRTGHPGGLLTLHASEAKMVKPRLCDLLSEVVAGDSTKLVDDTIDCVIQLGFVNNKRKILEVLEF